MTSRLRLASLPFLAATLAMALALILPWAFTPLAADAPGGDPVEAQAQHAPTHPVQLAGPGGPEREPVK